MPNGFDWQRRRGLTSPHRPGDGIPPAVVQLSEWGGKFSSAGLDGQLVAADSADLKAEIDKRWAQLKSGLVRGLSIGFNPIESARIEGTYGYRYTKTQLLELSTVTIAANADCSLTSIKSADQAIRRAASGARPVVRLDRAPALSGNTNPGASGATQTVRRKGVVYLK